MNDKISATPTASNKRHFGYNGIIMMAIVAVAFGVLNFLTPQYHDDFVYKFMFEGGSVN